MSNWSILLCEGPHDVEFLCSLASVASDWNHEPNRPDEVPGPFGKALCLSKGGRYLLLHGMDGVSNTLGRSGQLAAKNARGAHVFGALLDANAVGVNARRDEFIENFEKIFPNAATAEVGNIVRDDNISPGIGLWVAPDCKENGSLDSVIRKAVQHKIPDQLNIADAFIDTLGAAEQHEWDQYKDKAVLGALGQRMRAGVSLASSLQEREDWIDPNLATQKPFDQILHFLDMMIEE